MNEDPTKAPMEDELVAAATAGDRNAVVTLVEANAHAAWDLAVAVAGDAAVAAAALDDAVAATVTGLRSERLDPTRPFRIHLLTATRNSALDRTRASGTVATDQVETPDGRPPVLLAAFTSLPERWRSVLWLGEVQHLDHAHTALVAALAVDDTAVLATRARRGLLEQVVRTSLATAPAAKACGRAVTRLGGHVEGTLDAGDVLRLQRHLDLCDDCAARHDVVAAAVADLPLLALPLPDGATDRAVAAWLGVTGTVGATGLSVRTEKVLAGVSAFAAAVGVVGAALFGLGDGSQADAQLAAAPIAPLVDRVAAPQPFLPTGSLSVPAPTSSARNGGVAAGAVDAVAAAIAAPTAGAEDLPAEAPSTDGPATPAPATQAPATPDAEAPAPTEPASPAPDLPLPAIPLPALPIPEAIAPRIGVDLEVADTPIVIDIDEDPGITVGPLTLGTPEPSEAPISVGGVLEPLAPVTEPVAEILGGLGL